MGFEPMTSAMPVQCSTNWAIKPTGSWSCHKLTIWPAPSWLDSSVGRALHRHRRGHGFESHSSLNFFQAFFSQLLKLCSNCEDLSSIWSFIRSSNICFIYLHSFIHPSRVYHKLTIWPAPKWLDSSVGRALHRHRRGHGFESRSSLNFFQFFFSQLLKLCSNCEDLSSTWSFIRSSNVCFIYLHSFIHPSRVYHELTIWPAPSWLDSSVGRALHRHRRGHGFESHSSLNFFQVLFSQLLKLCSNCEDLSSIWSFIRSSNVCFIYLHSFIHPSRVYNELTIWPAPSWLDSSVGRALHRHRRGHGFESHSSLNFFQVFFSQLLKLCSNCEDLSSIWSFIRSSNICFIYLHSFPLFLIYQALSDPEYGVAVRAVKLRRKVEMYQWVEHQKTR